MAATDKQLYLRTDEVKSPARNCITITPSDSATLSNVTKAIYVGGAGDVVLTAVDDSSSVTFKAVPVGTVIPVRAKQVMATGTTATLLVGLC